ncbi:MAG TPA: SurA N-terminal domain-containing protein [Blastocatellia bacterium]|nr:SurA N-terminal domain-containing protein [Blastocatellia bacterium]
MLKFLRGRKRARNALLIVFIGLLTLSLVALFSASGSGKLFGSAAGSDTIVAKVGRYDITAKEMTDSLTSFGQQVAQGQARQRQDDMATLYDLYGQQVLDGLIRQKLILYEADNLNLTASDAEVQTRLKQIFSPWPGAEGYRQRLQQAGMTTIRFENDLRASLANEHLRSYITAAVEVDPKEVEADYKRTNTTFNIRWVEVDPEKMRDKVQVNDADLRAYFDGHKDNFKITSEQRRARYIFVDQEKGGEAIQIPDEELKQDFNAERYVKQVRVSQIVLNVPKQEAASADKDAAKPDAAKKPSVTEDDIRKKAQDIMTRAQGSAGKPAEDFAKLARELSEDPKTKAKGGDLGFINKDDKRDTDDPLNRVFTMKKDEVSQPVKKGDKYYILKVTDRQIPTFAAARADLLKEARSRKGYSKAVEIATEADQKLKETKNVDAVVAEINKKYGAPVAVARETSYFSEGDTIPELGSVSEFESSVFQLQNPGDVGERINVDKGFAVPQYIDKRDPHDPSFDEVRDKVDKAFRVDKAKELARARATEFTKITNTDELKRAAAAAGLKVDERAGLTGNDSIGPLISEADRAPLYKLNIGEVTREPIKTDTDVFVVAALLGRKDADMGEAFQKERKSIEQRLLDEKRTRFFSTYLSMTQKQMTDEGKIKIYSKEIDAAVQAIAGRPASGGAPGAPGAPGGPSRPRQRRTPQGVR